MSDSRGSSAERTCLMCDAKQAPGLTTCWLCGHRLPIAADSTAQGGGSVALKGQAFSFSMGTIMLLVTLVSVVFGVVAINPGLGVFVCILSVPVLVRTIMVVRARESLGQKVAPLQKLVLFASSLGMATVMAVVVSFAAFAGFCGVCLLAFSVGSGPQGPTPIGWMILIGLTVLLVISLIVSMGKWIRSRYRRDAGIEAFED